MVVGDCCPRECGHRRFTQRFDTERPIMSKLRSMPDAIAELVPDGASVALGNCIRHGAEFRHYWTLGVEPLGETAMTTLTRAAMAHNHAETSLTSRTAPTGAIRQITRASPIEKFASTSAKNARSRQQRVSVSNPSISNTHTA